VKATPPARVLAWSVDLLDTYWGPIAVSLIVTLEVVVFGPRGMVEWMIGAGVLGAALLVSWPAGFTG